MQWKDIDLDNAIIHITKAKESGNNNVKGTKTDAGNRDVPIPVALLETLRKNKRGPFQQVLHQAKNADKPHTENSMATMWRSFKRLVDIEMGAKVYRNKVITHGETIDLYESLVPYCLRHTYCTDLQDAGIPINVAKYLMGHSDISVTANIYTHTSEEIVHQAAIMASEHIDKKKTTKSS